MNKRIMLFGSLFLCFGLLVGCSSQLETKKGWDDFSSTEQSKLTEFGFNKEMIDWSCENYPDKCTMEAFEEDINSLDKASVETTLRAIKSQIEMYVRMESIENEEISNYTVDFSRGPVALEEIGYSSSSHLMPSSGTLTVNIEGKVTAENIVFKKYHCQYVNDKFECEQ